MYLSKINKIYKFLTKLNKKKKHLISEIGHKYFFHEHKEENKE